MSSNQSGMSNAKGRSLSNRVFLQQMLAQQGKKVPDLYGNRDQHIKAASTMSAIKLN